MILRKFFTVLLFSTTASSAMAQVDLSFLKAPVFKKDTIRVDKQGGVPDGVTLNTAVIQRSIDELSRRGGGTVYLRPGLWLTGPVVLKNNINLHITHGATLLFTKDFNQYKLEKSNWEGLPQMRNQSPISARNAQNIAITGKGTVDGNGDAWRMVKKEKLTANHWKILVASGGVLSDDEKIWYPSHQSKFGSTFKNPGFIEPGKDDKFYDSVKDFLRPNMVLLMQCKNILLEGVIFQNSAAWNLHPIMSENIIVRDITVRNPWYAQNGDGIDVESCKNVLIENSLFDVGDDALCMKSGRDEAGRERAMPTENVIIRNCIVYAAHGGFVIGSEMSGGARNIMVDNCSFYGTDIGLRFKTTRGRGGVVENIFISNIYMKDIVAEAILFDMYYEAKDPVPLAGVQRTLPKVEFKPKNETTPVFKNFTISNVFCNGAEKAIFLRGLPEQAVENIKFTNLVMHADEGIDIQESNNINFEKVSIFSTSKNPSVDIIQSRNLRFSGVTLNEKPVQYRIAGDRVKGILIEKSDPALKTGSSVITESGASTAEVKVL